MLESEKKNLKKLLRIFHATNTLKAAYKFTVVYFDYKFISSMYSSVI